jgi:putative membrane protein
VARDIDPDARFLLANERTVLAWLRTSLALQAGGVGVLRFGSFDLNEVIGAALILLGALAGGAGFLRYRAADRAIRRGELPPHGMAPEMLALAVAVLGVLLLAVSLGHKIG